MRPKWTVSGTCLNRKWTRNSQCDLLFEIFFVFVLFVLTTTQFLDLNSSARLPLETEETWNMSDSSVWTSRKNQNKTCTASFQNKTKTTESEWVRDLDQFYGNWHVKIAKELNFIWFLCIMFAYIFRYYYFISCIKIRLQLRFGNMPNKSNCGVNPTKSRFKSYTNWMTNEIKIA